MTGPTVRRNEILALVARVAIAALVLTACAVVLGRAFVGSANIGILQPFDDATRTATQTHLRALTGIASALATFGATLVILTAAAIISLTLWVRTHDLRRSALPLLAVLIADATGALTKILVARPRPTGDEIGLLEHYSFPSGHTVSAAALVAALFLLWRSNAQPQRRWPGILAATIVVGIVAVGRLVVDAHWATDVIAGTLVGLASAATARWALNASFSQAPPASPTQRLRRAEFHDGRRVRSAAEPNRAEPGRFAPTQPSRRGRVE